jgi:hypothetical protein
MEVGLDLAGQPLDIALDAAQPLLEGQQAALAVALCGGGLPLEFVS